MMNDFLVTLQHEGCLLKGLMVTDCIAIKTGNPLPLQGVASDKVGTTSAYLILFPASSWFDPNRLNEFICFVISNIAKLFSNQELVY